MCESLQPASNLKSRHRSNTCNNSHTPLNPQSTQAAGTSSCALELQRGYGTCSPAQFTAAHAQETNQACSKHAADSSGVDPATGSWTVPGQRAPGKKGAGKAPAPAAAGSATGKGNETAKVGSYSLPWAHGASGDAGLSNPFESPYNNPHDNPNWAYGWGGPYSNPWNSGYNNPWGGTRPGGPYGGNNSPWGGNAYPGQTNTQGQWSFSNGQWYWLQNGQWYWYNQGQYYYYANGQYYNNGQWNAMPPSLPSTGTSGGSSGGSATTPTDGQWSFSGGHWYYYYNKQWYWYDKPAGKYYYYNNGYYWKENAWHVVPAASAPAPGAAAGRRLH